MGLTRFQYVVYGALLLSKYRHMSSSIAHSIKCVLSPAPSEVFFKLLAAHQVPIHAG